jgi:hypothetical protein
MFRGDDTSFETGQGVDMSAPTSDPPSPPAVTVGAPAPSHQGRRFAAGFGLALLGHVLAAGIILLTVGLVAYALWVVELLLLAGAFIIGIRAIVRDNRAFGSGVLAGWFAGAVLAGIGFVILIAAALSQFN